MSNPWSHFHSLATTFHGLDVLCVSAYNIAKMDTLPLVAPFVGQKFGRERRPNGIVYKYVLVHFKYKSFCYDFFLWQNPFFIKTQNFSTTFDTPFALAVAGILP